MLRSDFSYHLPPALIAQEGAGIPQLTAKLDALTRNLILETNRVQSTGMPASGPFSALTSFEVDTVPPAWRPVMVLLGLRGALSLALVLSLPEALETGNDRIEVRLRVNARVRAIRDNRVETSSGDA